MAASQLSRVSSIVHLAIRVSRSESETPSHREPRFRDKLKAHVARKREFGRFLQLGDSAMTNDATSEN